MKRLTFLLAIICSSFQLFASTLHITGEIDVPFSVFINGEKYYSYNHAVTISNLPKGSYEVEIYTESQSYELLYQHTIDIPRNTTVDVRFTNDDKMYITSTKNSTPIEIHVQSYPKRHEPAKQHEVVKKENKVYHAQPKSTIEPKKKDSNKEIEPQKKDSNSQKPTDNKKVEPQKKDTQPSNRTTTQVKENKKEVNPNNNTNRSSSTSHTRSSVETRK